MKKIIFSGLFVFTALVFSNKTDAQVRVNVNVNIGDQPEWGPAGYDYAEYYYLPDIESYYYVPRRQFVYLDGGRWIFSAGLPPRYANYNLYNGYKVVFKTHDVYRNFETHRTRYSRYRNYNNRQVIIKNKHDNGNHYGQYKDKGNGHYKNKGKGKGKGHGN